MPSVGLGYQAIAVLLKRARQTLLSAWNDYYSRHYQWAIIKAWHAASTATLLLDPTGSRPISIRCLGSNCGTLRDLAGDVALLDSLYWACSDDWLGLILGDLGLGIGREAVLDSIEEAVKILDAVEACGIPKPWSLIELPSVRVPHAFRAGPVLVIVEEGVSNISLASRLTSSRESLIPGYYTLILSSDEALAYTRMPIFIEYDSSGEVEIVSDETGLVRMIISGIHT